MAPDERRGEGDNGVAEPPEAYGGRADCVSSGVEGCALLAQPHPLPGVAQMAFA